MRDFSNVLYKLGPIFWAYGYCHKIAPQRFDCQLKFPYQTYQALKEKLEDLKAVDFVVMSPDYVTVYINNSFCCKLVND